MNREEMDWQDWVVTTSCLLVMALWLVFALIGIV